MATEEIIRRSSTDAFWIFRIKYFVVKAALAILAEDPGTANHANRLAFAKQILSGADPEVFALYATAVLTNATIAAAEDPVLAVLSDVEFAVNSMLDAFATASV